MEPTPQFTNALAQLVFDQTTSVGTDMESFSRHAKRKTISVDDVLMICRRNDGLREVMENYIQSIQGHSQEEEADDTMATNEEDTTI